MSLQLVDVIGPTSEFSRTRVGREPFVTRVIDEERSHRIGERVGICLIDN